MCILSLPNRSIDSVQSQAKSQRFYSFFNYKLILKFIKKWKKLKIAKTILKKNKAGGLILPDIRTANMELFVGIICISIKLYQTSISFPITFVFIFINGMYYVYLHFY